MERSIWLIKGLSLIVVFLIVIFVGMALYEVGRNPIDLSLYEVAEVTSRPHVNIFNNHLPANRGNKEEIKLVFFGDLMLDRHVKERIDRYGFDYLLDKLATTTGLELTRYQLVSANLEGAVTDKGEHYLPESTYDFAFNPVVVSRLSDYGFNFFNIANNHILDQGSEGRKETERNLDRLGFGYSGCSDGVIDDCGKIIKLAGKKLGLAGYSMVYSKLGEDKLASNVGKLAEDSDFTIVQMHWGVEYEHNYNPLQQQVAHTLIDAGADAVIGHHPHVVQGIEIYKNKPIFYSLGNFIFDQYFSPDTQEGLAVGIKLDEDSVVYELIPIKSHMSQVELMNNEDKQEFINKLIGWSVLSEEYKYQILRTSNFTLLTL